MMIERPLHKLHEKDIHTLQYNSYINSFNNYFIEVGPNFAQQIPQTATNFCTFIKPAELVDFTESKVQ